jgi:hypothetical protein
MPSIEKRMDSVGLPSERVEDRLRCLTPTGTDPDGLLKDSHCSAAWLRPECRRSAESSTEHGL